jgi:hypothetical protein
MQFLLLNLKGFFLCERCCEHIEASRNRLFARDRGKNFRYLSRVILKKRL